MIEYGMPLFLVAVTVIFVSAGFKDAILGVFQNASSMPLK